MGTSGWVSMTSTRNSASRSCRAARRPVDEPTLCLSSGPANTSSTSARSARAARHRADHGQVVARTAAAGVFGQCVPRAGTRPKRRLVGEHAADSAPARGASRRCPSRARGHSSRPPALRPTRRTSRLACDRDPRDCWWCRRSRCRSASRPSATGTLVLPRSTAPAALSRCDRERVLAGAPKSLNAGIPQVVGRPATLNDSFTVIGTPSNGRRSPRASAWSAAFAAGGPGRSHAPPRR